MYGEKLPPHDMDAEEAVNGSLLIDGTAIHKIASLLSQQDFYSEQNKLVYDACLSLYQRDEVINQITVAQELDRQQKLEACGGTAYLSHLISIVPTSLDIENYAQIVYRLSVMRHLITAGSQIQAIGYEADPDINASLSKAEDTLFNLRHGENSQGFVHVRQVLDKYFESANEPATQAEDSQKPITSVMSGFTAMDDLMNGFQPSDLIILAGRTSMGKTGLVLSAARNAAVNQGACVALFSLEMSRESIGLRLLASESGVNARRVRFGAHLYEEEEKNIMDATGILSEAPIYIDDSPQLRIVEMRSKARRLHYERGINLIIVDYLQLMQGEGRRENRVQEIGYISRSLKALARDLNVPVIALSQLSRQVDWRSSHIPQLSDLRESGNIEQDADIVMFVHREEAYYPNIEDWQNQFPDKEYPKEIADVIIAKHRNGPTGQIKLRFRHSLAKFENINNIEEPSLF